jgi:hypothetical protein
MRFFTRNSNKIGLEGPIRPAIPINYEQFYQEIPSYMTQNIKSFQREIGEKGDKEDTGSQELK